MLTARRLGLLALILAVIALIWSGVLVLALVAETSSAKTPISSDGRVDAVRVEAHEATMVWAFGERPERGSCSVTDRADKSSLALDPVRGVNTTGADGYWEAWYRFDSGSGRLNVQCHTPDESRLTLWHAFDWPWLRGWALRMAPPVVLGLIAFGAMIGWVRRRDQPVGSAP